MFLRLFIPKEKEAPTREIGFAILKHYYNPSGSAKFIYVSG